VGENAAESEERDGEEMAVGEGREGGGEKEKEKEEALSSGTPRVKKAARASLARLVSRQPRPRRVSSASAECGSSISSSTTIIITFA
jgi:hypothetical protein